MIAEVDVEEEVELVSTAAWHPVISVRQTISSKNILFRYLLL